MSENLPEVLESLNVGESLLHVSVLVPFMGPCVSDVPVSFVGASLTKDNVSLGRKERQKRLRTRDVPS